VDKISVTEFLTQSNHLMYLVGILVLLLLIIGILIIGACKGSSRVESELEERVGGGIKHTKTRRHEICAGAFSL